MDYTCENCKSRYAWDCEDRGHRRKCKYFDEDTLDYNEKILLKEAMKELIKENDNER